MRRGSVAAGGDHRPGAGGRIRGRSRLTLHDVLGPDQRLSLAPYTPPGRPPKRFDHRMRLRADPAPPAAVNAEVLAVPIYREDAEPAPDLAEVDTASGGAISRAIEWGEFNVIEHASALVPAGDLPASWL